MSAPDLAARVAALRVRGYYVTPDGAPGRPRWKVSRLEGLSHVYCEEYTATELEAVELAEQRAGAARPC